MKEIILDVDGTLWDTTEVVAKAWQKAVMEVGVESELITGDTLKREFGKTMDAIADSLFPRATQVEKQKIMDLCCAYEHEDLHATSENLLYPEVRETIIELSKSYKVYIVSNCQSGYIELFLEKNDLASYVQDIECFGNTGKNKGENLKLITARNHMESPVYVGDTQGDFEATRAAQMPFVFASYGFGNPDGGEYVIKSFKDLLTIFQPLSE